MVKIKCPKCKKLFNSYAPYTKHYASAHYTKKAKKAGGKKGWVMGKTPHWAKGKKKRR